jgi:PAS domain S-box-containing protein
MINKSTTLHSIEKTKKRVIEKKGQIVRYVRLIEAVSDFIYSVNIKDGLADKTTYWGACERVTGYSAVELKTDNTLWTNLIPVEDRYILNNLITRLFSHEANEPIEHRIIRKDGEYRWVSNTLIPHYDKSGKLLSYDGMIREITDKKRLEEKMKSDEERFRKLFFGMTEGMLVVSDEGIITQANPAAAKILNVRTDDIINTPFFLQGQTIYNQDGTTVKPGENPIVSALTDHRTIVHWAMGIEFHGNSLTWLDINTIPIRFDENGPESVIVTFTDITETIEHDKIHHLLQLKVAKLLTKVLSGYLTVCSSCKMIKDDNGEWVTIEKYVKDHSEAEFTHGICPKCGLALYGDLYTEMERDFKQEPLISATHT